MDANISPWIDRASIQGEILASKGRTYTLHAMTRQDMTRHEERDEEDEDGRYEGYEDYEDDEERDEEEDEDDGERDQEEDERYEAQPALAAFADRERLAGWVGWGLQLPFSAEVVLGLEPVARGGASRFGHVV